jgi:glutathione S-transferase
MLGQNGHFLLYAPERILYAIDRYNREARRLYGVLDSHLGEGGDYIAGDYSIADMACFPWIMTHKALAHVPAKWIRFADKDMRQHKNLRRFPVISDHRVIRYDRKAL